MRAGPDRRGQAGPVVTASESHPAEPSPLARLTIKVGPQERWGAAEGSVPGDQAHDLITTFGVLGNTFGILGCASAGIAGAVLTIRGSGLTDLAFAELVLALLAAMLIAACSLIRARQEDRASLARRSKAADQIQARQTMSAQDGNDVPQGQPATHDTESRGRLTRRRQG